MWGRPSGLNAMEIDDNGGEASYSLFDVFGGLVSDDFFHVTVLCGTRDGSFEFRFEVVEPSIVYAYTNGMNSEFSNEFVALPQHS